MKSNTQAKPVFKTRCGDVHASVWLNEGKHGPFLSVRYETRYHNGEGEYQSGDTFTELQNAALCLVAQRVDAYIAAHRPARAEAEQAA